MISPQGLFRGLVSRILPTPNADSQNNDIALRMGRYGEASVLSVVRKSHLLADEGAYFTAHNNQTAVTSVFAATFVATTPLAIISNNDSVGGRRLYLDYMALVTGTAGAWASAGVNVQAMIVIDSALRYSSGGTTITAIQCPNMDISNAKSIASVYFGAPTATTATGVARTIVGLRILRAATSATVADVTGEMKYFNFGGVEGSMFGSITIANANIIPIPMPPIVIGPQQSALIYYVMNGTTPSAQTFFPEFGWWER
jgi:hypothetical protein